MNKSIEVENALIWFQWAFMNR